MSIAHHETLTQLKHCQLDREKLQKKVNNDIRFVYNTTGCKFLLFNQFDLLSVELSSCQHEGEASLRRLEKQLVHVTQRLEGYEKIEKELDDIVLQSAQC